MVIETAALLAILLGEPERGNFLQLLSESETRLLSAANAMETAIIVEGAAERVARSEGLEIVDVEWKVGKQRFLRVYIDRIPKPTAAMSDAAGLNFGDCFAYALTKTSSEPLLARSEGFRRTDLQVL